MVAAVTAGDLAMKEQDWRALGTANMMFHQAVGALADSPRVDELMRDILAELRLVFHTMADPRRFHEPYLERNKEILAAIEAGDGPRRRAAAAQVPGRLRAPDRRGVPERLNRTACPGRACASTGRSAARTTPITG